MASTITPANKSASLYRVYWTDNNGYEEEIPNVIGVSSGFEYLIETSRQQIENVLKLHLREQDDNRCAQKIKSLSKQGKVSILVKLSNSSGPDTISSICRYDSICVKGMSIPALKKLSSYTEPEITDFIIVASIWYETFKYELL